ncbi:sugar phosphate nucleotidyltransferase [Halomarina rubra]|uniref:Bifunctional protein GlmU n=1 Tax=Halomarina rubra TaxID=2071873 RepID=A0ABD6AVN1_9EURY|nr:sugar phosphate nucleotidyltransferase [Halomarina rubra]
MTIDTAVVLAAGEGNRLRPLTHNRPKPMLPAANRPILEYVLDALVDAGISKLCLVVGYKRDRVQDHFGPTYRDVPIDYVVQKKQLGSGHALQQAAGAVDDSFVVVNGDRVIQSKMVSAVVDAHEDASAVLAVLEHGNAQRYGAVDVENDTITAFVEKPDRRAFRLINAGVYAFDRSIFDALARADRIDGTLPLTTAVESLVAERKVQAVRTNGLWVDATYPWDLLEVAREVLRHGLVEAPERDRDVWVADSARIDPEATLQGPVVVGPDTEVAAGAVVGPNVALGRNATVGANATVEGAVLDTDTRVGAGSVLVDCVTGHDVHLGPATVVPGGPADVQVGDAIHRGERLGAVFGDRVRAEGGVSCAPGTLVGTSARLRTGVVVAGQVKTDTEVVR